MTFTKEQLISAAHARIKFAEMMLAGNSDPLNENTWGIALQLHRMALAGMEAEPVGITDKSEIECLKRGEMANVMPPDYKGCDVGDSVCLYDTPQPLTTSERAELENYRNAQQVVPDDAQSRELFEKWCSVNIERNKWHPEHYAHLPAREQWNAWRACRAAMQGKAETVIQPSTLRDRVEALRTSGIAIDSGKIHAERAALNEPVCWCRTCWPVSDFNVLFSVCPECGNKRCPHANDHRNACTGSNEPGQEGSAYPAAPQQEAE